MWPLGAGAGLAGIGLLVYGYGRRRMNVADATFLSWYAAMPDATSLQFQSQAGIRDSERNQGIMAQKAGAIVGALGVVVGAVGLYRAVK
jgi:hypothetical protein